MVEVPSLQSSFLLLHVPWSKFCPSLLPSPTNANVKVVQHLANVECLQPALRYMRSSLQNAAVLRAKGIINNLIRKLLIGLLVRRSVFIRWQLFLFILIRQHQILALLCIAA